MNELPVSYGILHTSSHHLRRNVARVRKNFIPYVRGSILVLQDLCFGVGIDIIHHFWHGTRTVFTQNSLLVLVWPLLIKRKHWFVIALKQWLLVFPSPIKTTLCACVYLQSVNSSHAIYIVVITLAIVPRIPMSYSFCSFRLNTSSIGKSVLLSILFHGIDKQNLN